MAFFLAYVTEMGNDWLTGHWRKGILHLRETKDGYPSSVTKRTGVSTWPEDLSLDSAITMFSLFRSATSTPRPSAKTTGTKRAARNAKQRSQYSDPLPFVPPSPSFNIFSPSTYKSLITTAASPEPYVGAWCPATRSVNVNSDVDGVEIWRRGMWGKGTLSRSSPTWRIRKAQEMTGGKHLSLEELTALKRKERAEFKEERLKKERLERERVLRAEQTGEELPKEEEKDEEQPKRKRVKMSSSQTAQELPVYSESYLDKEKLQLSPEEALFLFHLKLLTVTYNNRHLSLSQFLHLIATSSQPDDPFLVHFIAYYHYRRQRLIVKPGLKFGVDYLIYDRPIPLAHAAHCINVIGNYHLWDADSEEKLVRDKISWQEINLWQRLMGNVRKRLKLIYVEIPRPDAGRDWRDVESREEFENVLMKYRIREVMNSRMVIARERDVKPDTK